MILPITADLYQTLCSWWTTHSWPAIPREMLPMRGYMAFQNDTPVIAGFLYRDDTSLVGMIEWIVSNPDVSHGTKQAGFTELMTHIALVAKGLGLRALFTTSNNSNLNDKLIGHGFNKTDEAMTHFLKEI